MSKNETSGKCTFLAIFHVTKMSHGWHTQLNKKQKHHVQPHSTNRVPENGHFWWNLLIFKFMIWTFADSKAVQIRVHHYPSKAAFQSLEKFSIPKALDLKSTFSTLISKAQKPISKNRVLSLRIEKKFGPFFPLLSGDWTKIGGRFLTDHFKLKDRSFYLTNGNL